MGTLWWLLFQMLKRPCDVYKQMGLHIPEQHLFIQYLMQQRLLAILKVPSHRHSVTALFLFLIYEMLTIKA